MTVSLGFLDYLIKYVQSSFPAPPPPPKKTKTKTATPSLNCWQATEGERRQEGTEKQRSPYSISLSSDRSAHNIYQSEAHKPTISVMLSPRNSVQTLLLLVFRVKIKHANIPWRSHHSVLSSSLTSQIIFTLLFSPSLSLFPVASNLSLNLLNW